VEKIVYDAIEIALRQKLKEQCPGYGKKTIDDVVAASMKHAPEGCSKDLLIRAILIAYNMDRN
jgi:hypothetical protein